MEFISDYHKRQNCPNCKKDSLITLSNGIYCMDDCCGYFKSKNTQIDIPIDSK